MKKTLLIAAIALIGTSAFAQTDTNKQSEKITKYVTTFPNGEEAITITDKSTSSKLELSSADNFYKYEILETAINVARGLVEETRAECVIPLGGAIIPYIVDPADIEAAIGVPVFNTKSVTIRFAETCVNLGLAHSPKTYPRADLKYEDFAAQAQGIGGNA